MPSFGPELLSTFNAVSQIASRLLPLIEHVPDSLGKWVPPLKKISQGFEKQAATLALASAGANVLRGRLGVVGATVAAMNTQTLTGSKRFSILAGVGGFAASRIIAGMRRSSSETQHLSSTASQASRQLHSVESAANAVHSAGGGIGGALSGGIGKLVALAAAAKGAINFAERFKAAIDLGGHLQDLSDKTGLAADQVMILEQAGKDNGVEDVSASVAKMQKNLVEVAKTGSGPAAEAFALLGLNARDLAKGLPTDAMTAIGGKIAALQNPALQTATAMAIFGKSGAELLPLFKDAGAMGTAAASIGKQAEILKENASRFDAVSDRLGRSGLKLQGFFVGMVSTILPTLEGITKHFDQLDLAEQGQRFGTAIRTAAIYFTGAFADPGALADLLGSSLKLAFARSVNFLFNASKHIAESFGPELALGIVNSMDAVRNAFGALLDAIKHPGKNFGSAITGIATKLSSSLHLTSSGDVDLFGVGEYEKAVEAAKNRLRNSGTVIVSALEEFGYSVQKKAQDAAPQLGGLSNNGGLKGASNAMSAGDFAGRFSPGFGSQVVFSNGTTRETSALASRAAFGQTSLLSAAERASITDAAVANGRTRQGSTSAAFGAVRAGDRARRQNVERAELRQQSALDVANTHLDGLNIKMDKYWSGES